MSKTRLLQNKEAVITMSIGVMLMLLFLVNLVVIVPQLLSAYQLDAKKANQAPLDAQVIQKAVDYLNQ